MINRFSFRNGSVDMKFVSPSGETVVFTGYHGRRWFNPRHRISGETRIEYETRYSDTVKKIKDLLSRGFVCVETKRPEDPWQAAEEPKTDDVERKEAKKDTSEVDGSSQTGSQSHGGKHASGEVEDSPNSYPNGRKKRGGRKNKKDHHHTNKNQKPQNLQKQKGGGTQSGGTGVYAYTPLAVNPKILQSSQESAKLLTRLIGRLGEKMPKGQKVDVHGLLTALETGDNPVPFIEAKDAVRKKKILVTPDMSGSCQNWSGVSRAWALQLGQNKADLDVTYVENVNAAFCNDQGYLFGDYMTKTKKDYDNEEEFIKNFDVIIYLGDGDGEGLAHHRGKMGATCLALDSHCASYGNPRLEVTKYNGGGRVFWVDRVSTKSPETWVEALRLCINKL